MNIVFVIASVELGGAERVAATLANAWVERGHTVEFLTLEPPDVAAAYALREGIHINRLGLAGSSSGILGAVFSNLNRARVLRGAIRDARADIVVSFMLEMNVLTLFASIGRNWPVVISERVHPAHHPVSRIWDFLRRRIYSRADATVAQTSEIATWLERTTGARTQVIANPIEIAKFQGRSGQKKPAGKILLAVGRLDRQKGYDVVIAAFAKAAADIPEWDLSIVGEGPERLALQRMIDGLGMSGRISLAGVSSDIVSVYDRADAVVHGARYEGYPNVILEALAAGKPIIAVDSPGATRELLGDGRYGVLTPVEDTDVLASALRTTLNDPEKLHSLSRIAADAVAANDVARVAPVWLDLFAQIIRAKSQTRR